MGQAKLRGSVQDRVAHAKSKIDALRPEKLVCNSCKTEFSDFDVMDSKGLHGIDAVFAGICPSCNSTTFAYRGEPEAVADLALAQQEIMGKGRIGFQKI